MIIVLTHYNTYRKSPYGESWQDTIFKCLKNFPNIKKIVIDWGSDDDSNVSTKKICEQEGYLYKEIDIKSQKFSWFEYLREWFSIVSNIVSDKEYFLYLEADTYICGNEQQIIESQKIMEENENIGIVNMARLDYDGIRPLYVDKRINNGFLLPKIHSMKSKFNFKSNEIDLLSSRNKITRIWNNWTIQCSLFKFSYFKWAFEKLDNSNDYRKDKKKGFFNLGAIFCDKYDCAVGDYIFSYNYGSHLTKDYKKAISICSDYSDCRIIDICKQSILNFKECVYKNDER